MRGREGGGGDRRGEGEREGEKERGRGRWQKREGVRGREGGRVRGKIEAKWECCKENELCATILHATIGVVWNKEQGPSPV